MSSVNVLTREGRAMARGRIGIAAASVAVVAGGLLAALGATAAGASSGACATPGKCYLTMVAPQSVPAGESQAFTFTVTNEATTQSLGSVQVTAPAGFIVTNASAPVGNASYTANSALFLNLGLNPTQSATLTVYASAPCSGGASGWSLEAKQSNQFNGPNNGFVLDSTSILGATVSGSCSLAFLNEPSGGVAGSPITSQVGQPAATNPVSVEVLGSDNKVVTSSNAVITLTIGANPNSPTPVALSGTTQVQASQGVANFSNVIIGQTGWPYTLVATSPGNTQQPTATSSYFGIYGSWQGCSGGPCSGTAVTKTTTGTVTTSTALSGQFVGVGLGGLAGFSCSGSYQPASDPLNFDVLNPSGATSSALFTVTLEVSKQVVQSSGHPGASSWQVCFASNVQFPAQPGTSLQPIIGGVQYYTGLLLDCTNNTPANTPCVLSRNKDNAGNVLVTFLGYGDMNGRI
jgi:hypothetical protein